MTFHVNEFQREMDGASVDAENRLFSPADRVHFHNRFLIISFIWICLQMKRYAILWCKAIQEQNCFEAMINGNANEQIVESFPNTHKLTDYVNLSCSSQHGTSASGTKFKCMDNIGSHAIGHNVEDDESPWTVARYLARDLS